MSNTVNVDGTRYMGSDSNTLFRVAAVALLDAVPPRPPRGQSSNILFQKKMNENLQHDSQPLAHQRVRGRRRPWELSRVIIYCNGRPEKMNKVELKFQIFFDKRVRLSSPYGTHDRS